MSTITRRATSAGVCFVLLTLGLAACGGDGSESLPPPAPAAASTPAAAKPTASPTASAAAAVAATIKSNAVSPEKLTVKPGEKITITNSDKVAHELADTKDKLTTGTIKASGSGTMTAPAKAGTYTLADPSHSTAKLTLVVS